MVQLGIAIGKVRRIREPVRTPRRRRLVVNRGPRDAVGATRCHGGANCKRQSMCKGKFEALQQVATLLVVGNVCRPLGGGMALTGMFMV